MKGSIKGSIKGSMKSSEAEKKEYNYIINSHGAIFTSLKENEKKYISHRIHIYGIYRLL